MESASPYQSLAHRLDRLLPLYGLQASRTAVMDMFACMNGDSLAVYPDFSGPRRSSLTTDGFPFEASVALTAHGAEAGLRYAADSGTLALPFATRLQQSDRRTAVMLQRVGAGDVLALHRSVFDTVFPAAMREHELRFGLWHGIVHRPHRPAVLKVYYNLRPWQAPMDAVLGALGSLLGPYADVSSLCQPPPFEGRIAFLCVEYSAHRSVKIKLYHRCPHAVHRRDIDAFLVRLGLTEHLPRLERVHALLAHGDSYPERSLMYYLGQQGGTGGTSLNLYLNLPPFVAGDAAARSLTLALAAALDVDPTLYERSLAIVAGTEMPERGFHYHTMLGICVAPNAAHLNVYFKPTWDSLRRSAHAQILIST